MPRENRKQLTKENREVVEAGIREGASCRLIAKRLGVAPSTVTREVRANRTVREVRSRTGKLSTRCASYRDCDRVGTACGGCSTAFTRCRDCRTRDCTASCPGYERRMCALTERWPWTCPEACPKRRSCGFPKCSYRAEEADAAHRGRLSSSRSGISLSPAELAGLDAAVAALVRQGHSFEAVAAELGDELPVSVRTLYRYQEAGALSTANIELPRKVRCRPRKRKRPDPGRPRVDRTGREYSDFEALPIEDRCRVVQMDSVEGYEWNERDILSAHLVARGFQLYVGKRHADPAATVGAPARIEISLGSREAFEAALGIILADRGVEFDDFGRMERSVLEPGRRRCRVFYCDPLATNQKSQCERNHEQLRRILPKGRSDLDRLSQADVAECCSHVNSYPLRRLGGRCPLDCVGDLLPAAALEALGIERLEPARVVLRPSLMPHAVKR